MKSPYTPEAGIFGKTVIIALADRVLAEFDTVIVASPSPTPNIIPFWSISMIFGSVELQLKLSLGF